MPANPAWYPTGPRFYGNATATETPMQLKFKKTHTDAIIPTRAWPGDSGLDLHACLPAQAYAIIEPGGRGRFWSGIAIELPEPYVIAIELPEPYVGDAANGLLWCGWEAQVRGRSGLTNQGIIACGGLGTVDSGYRGDIGVTLFNTTARPFEVKHGDRIAQLVVCPVSYPELIEVDELSDTLRGTGGFGSTGV